MPKPVESIPFNLSFLKSFARLFALYWWSEERWRALRLLVFSVVLTFAAVRGSLMINQGNKLFFDALQSVNRSQVLAAFYPFSLGISLWIGSEAVAFYCKERLCARWRQWLTTNHLVRWFADHKHYHLSMDATVDNPDQRISEDLGSFPVLTLGLFFLLLNAVLLLVSYGYLLWDISSTMRVPIAGHSVTLYGYLFWCALFYGGLSLVLTQKIGKKLAILDFLSERYGANFRYALVRSREASEPIALSNTGTQEASRLKRLYDAVFANTLDTINLRTRLNACAGFFSGSGAIVGAVVTLPLFFMQHAQMGTLIQASGAFAMVFSAFKMLAQSFDEFAQWKSVVYRLFQFNQALDKAPVRAKSVVHHHAVSSIHVNNLSVSLPNGQALFSRLTMVFDSGASYLIQGPSGIGKSVFLRTMAGIWPHAQGEIFYPQEKSMVFVPQKPYLPMTSLADFLCSSGGVMLDDEALQMLLQRVQLHKYARRLHEVQHWQSILSLGEQQRLFLVPLLIKKPDIIFLDEATSALDVASERDFYQLIKEEIPQATIISIGHRETLHAYHQYRIHLNDVRLFTESEVSPSDEALSINVP